MISKLDNMLGFHQKALNMRSARQTLLASNIANADTPGFKARDFDFSRALQNSFAPNQMNVGLQATSAKHINPSSFRSIGSSQAQYRIPQQPSVDGNTVDMDAERMQFADNALRYDAGLTFISGQIRGLLSAIREGS
ncbi:MAG: flagellar basal body rod protein FlgB [Nitrosomonas sp.]|nr:flagellar basal body rod protein FlgB [Nitrosomonas sp.]MCC7136658.1 flagellar basal body rod protein FlgB [Nitrosomonas sp.]